MEGTIRVVVADDHPLYREGVARALAAAGCDVVGEADTGPQALDLIRELAPDIALVDYRLPPPDGIAIAAEIAQGELPTRVLLLSAYADQDLVYKALESGACGFVVKEARRQEIVTAVRDCAGGATFISPGLTAGIASVIRRRATTSAVPLSEREREILVRFAGGESIPAIGKALFLSTSTVKTHVQRLYEKLGVNDRAAAVAEGMRRGLIE
jgi:two-component system nitrate/nitrite response regulator NarL